eukprot:358763-Chlamydomonas_euryale.AAC.4
MDFSDLSQGRKLNVLVPRKPGLRKEVVLPEASHVPSADLLVLPIQQKCHLSEASKVRQSAYNPIARLSTHVAMLSNCGSGACNTLPVGGRCRRATQRIYNVITNKRQPRKRKGRGSAYARSCLAQPEPSPQPYAEARGSLVSVHTYQVWPAEQRPAHHVLRRARSGTKSQSVTAPFMPTF